MAMALDRDKLTLVLKLLDSPHDGEVLAAARAIVRMMKSAGMEPSDLAQESDTTDLMRRSMFAERAALDRMMRQLQEERAAFEEEKDRHYMAQAGEGMTDQTKADIFDKVSNNPYVNRFGQQSEQFKQQHHTKEFIDDDPKGWTEKTYWDDMNRTQAVNASFNSKWDAFAKVDVLRAGWILGHRSFNSVAQQAFDFASKHGRLHSMQQKAIDVFMRNR